MMKNVIQVVCVAAIVVALGSSAMAYSAKYWGREDGHLQMWWTKQGVRISEHPFVDDDYTKHINLIWPAPAPDINDADQRFIKSGSSKTSDTNALAGAAYTYDRFEDYLVDFGPSVTWFTLRDDADLANVSVQVDLVVWGDYLRTNALPDPETVFPFDSLGQCPELPGYIATNLDTSDPFSGPMVAAGLTTLAVPEPATMSLLALGLGALAVRRRRRS